MREVAAALGYTPDFSTHHRAFRVFLRRADHSSDIWLSFHGISGGFNVIGVIAVFANSGSARILGDDIFRITNDEPLEEMKPRFNAWLQACLAAGISKWRQTLI